MTSPTIVNAYVDRDSNLVLMRREGDDRIVERVPAEFVTYHRVADLPWQKMRRLERADGFLFARQEGDWFRVGWAGYSARKLALQDDGVFARQQVPHFEADVHPVKRFLVDSGAHIQRPKRAFLDIETDSRLSFEKLRAGLGRVLCWTVVDEVGKVVSGVLAADSDDAERNLLVSLLRALDPYDQVVAWNGDGFDFVVLNGDRRAKTDGRLRRLGIVIDTRRWLWLDHLALFRRMNLQVAKSGDEKQSFKLQDIATSVLGEGKDKFDSSKTWDAWLCTDATAKHNRDRLVKYNQKDTDLLRRIEEKTGYCALLDTIGDACGTLPDSRGMRPLNQLDPFMLRLGRDRAMHFPTISRFESEDDRKKFAGAYVMEPKFPPGIQRYVHVCDFKSLYPSIIISWNMSPETKVLESRGSDGAIPKNCARAPGTGVVFRTDVQGLLPLAVDRLLTLRSSFKKLKSSLPPGTPEWHDADAKSNAYKVTSNSFFGGTGNEYSRFFDIDVAESITQAGVFLDHAIEDALAADGWFVGYGDTDSTMVAGHEDRHKFNACVNGLLNKEVIPRVMEEHGCIDRRVAISYEKQFNRIVFCGKKRYFASYVHYEGSDARPDSKPEIKGLEFKRGDTNKIARRLQERVIRMILGDWDPPHDPPVENPELFRVLMVQARDYVLTSAKLPLDAVMVSKGIQRPIADYVQKKKLDGSLAAQPPHVQVARLLQERGADVSIGTKIAYVVIDGADNVQAIPAEDYTGECDRFYLWENLVWPPLERVLVAAFPGTPWHRMFGKVRPAKERSPKRGGAAPGQIGLFGGEVPVLPVSASPPVAVAEASPAESRIPKRRRDVPVVIRIPIEKASSEVVRELREACARHPGPRSVRVAFEGTIDGGIGDVTLDFIASADVRVAGTPALLAEIESILGRAV